MTSRILAFVSLLVLTACAYTLDKSIQQLTVETPGANNALCYVYVDGLRYRFRPPQTQQVSKSKKDLVIKCDAPGNRHREVVIEPKTSDRTTLNLLNGGAPGIAVDTLSGAIYEYPSVVYVDFVNMPATSQPLPAHDSPDILPSDAYNLEEIRAKTPRLNSDKGIQPVEIRQRQPQPAIFAPSQPAAAPQPVIEPIIEPISVDSLRTEAEVSDNPDDPLPEWVK